MKKGQGQVLHKKQVQEVRILVAIIIVSLMFMLFIITSRCVLDTLF